MRLVLMAQAFLPRDAMLARYVLSSCVCLSPVRPSVTSRCSTKTAERRITQSVPYDSSVTPAKFDRGHPKRGRQFSPEFGTVFQREVPLFLEVHESFPAATV